MSETSNLWYFENVDLFELLCPTKVGNMEENQIITKFNKGDFIYFPEDQVKNVYMIAEGRIRIGTYNDDGKEIVKAILSTGELFGEMALTGEEIRSDFAQAMDNNTRVCPMSVDDMQKLMADNNELSFKIVKLMGLRLRKLERRIESLVFKDARTRIVEFLKEAAEWKGRKVGYETLIPTSLTHKDIAQLTGTSRQTVTTILNELKDDNIIILTEDKS